ncbi:MAG: hypothetical protein ACKO2L_14010 [Planctomycetaceae bacterium]
MDQRPAELLQFPVRRTRFVTRKIPPRVSQSSPPRLFQRRRQPTPLQLLLGRIHQRQRLLGIGMLQHRQTSTKRTWNDSRTPHPEH